MCVEDRKQGMRKNGRNRIRKGQGRENERRNISRKKMKTTRTCLKRKQTRQKENETHAKKDNICTHLVISGKVSHKKLGSMFHHMYCNHDSCGVSKVR